MDEHVWEYMQHLQGPEPTEEEIAESDAHFFSRLNIEPKE